MTYKSIYSADGKEISKEQEAYSTYEKRDKKYIVGVKGDWDPWEDEDFFDPSYGEDPVNPFNPFDPVEPELGSDTDTDPFS